MVAHPADPSAGFLDSLREYPSPERPFATLILAHGAGAGQDHRSIVGLAKHIAARGVRTFTFNFPYMQAGRRRPDSPALLESAWLLVIRAVGTRQPDPSSLLFIGGRSMGGRLATHVAGRDDLDARRVAGVVCFGYPLHPPGRATPRALDHFAALRCPVLIVQGTRDRFGGPDQVRTAVAGINDRVDVYEVADADHGLEVPRSTHRTFDAVLDEVTAHVVAWMRAVNGARN